MATNIPPHNLTEVINAVLQIIENEKENKETLIDDILKIVKGPDFPTGATILGTRGIEEAYRTGRGKIRVRAVTEIETMPNGKNMIIVTELPYMVNKAKLVEKIAELHKDKKVDGITALRDESSREGMRIVIELRKDVNPNVVLNQLYKHSQLQDTFGVIMLALVNNEPKILNILDMLKLYLLHQEDVVTRRTKYDLNKAEERAHILKGLLIALDNIDEVISIIRSSKTTAEAKQRLCDRFDLSDVQSQSIIDMRLRKLTGLEREATENEYNEIMIRIAEYKKILSDRNELLTVISNEITIIRDKYGDDRRTAIGYDEFDISMEDMIPCENTVVAMTSLGYIKRMTVDNFRSQNRGGKGIKGMQTIANDYIEELFMTTSHHYIMFFTNKGKVYRLKAYEIPEAGRTARGTAIVNLLQITADEKITAVIPLKEYEDDKYLFMATKNGTVKKTKINEYINIRKKGLQAINLRDDDELIEVKITDNTNDIILVTKNGMCIRFKETDVRNTGRNSMGVIGMNLTFDDEIVAMQVSSQGSDILIVSEKGLGKRTDIEEFGVQHRGGKGVKCYKITEKSGVVIGAKIIDENREILLITNEGIVIRLAVSGISKLGRITTGVKLMNVDSEKDIFVATMARVKDTNPDGSPITEIEHEEEIDEENEKSEEDD